MIDALDRSLEAFLRRAVPLPASQIDVMFGAPDRDWTAQRNRPTVGLFLYSIVPATTRAASGLRERRVGGDTVRERDLPTMALTYVMTAWVSDPADEHRLLGDLMRTVASNSELPTQDRDPALPFPTERLSMSLVGEKDRPRFDGWGSLGISPRVSLDLTVYLPAGPPLSMDTAEPPTTVDIDLADTERPTRASHRRRLAGRTDPANAGRRVVGRRGSATVEESGHFTLPGDSVDELRLVSDTDPDGEPLTSFTEDADGERSDDG